MPIDCEITTMKILLIQSYLGQGIPPTFPLGLAYLAACLPDHELRVLDLNIYQYPYEELQNVIVEFSPDIIGVSLRNIDDQSRLFIRYFYKEYQIVIKRIKQLAPDTPLITGGAGFSMFAHKIMERNPEIDFGILQEGEESLPELLENLDNPENVKGIFYRNKAAVFFTGNRKLPDIDRLPFPRRELIDISKYPVTSLPYALGLQTKRGCSLNCTYCNYPFLSGNKVRFRSPANVVDEIQELQKKHGINNFIFTDSVFNIPIEHASVICEEIIRRGLDVRWGAYLDLRFADEEFLFLAKRAGCNDFIFSPDAVSEAALRGLNKGITREDIDRVYNLFKKNEKFKQVHVFFSFFLSGVEETFWGLLQTLFYYIKIKVFLANNGGASVSWIRIEPDTDIYRMAIENKLLKADTDLLPETAAGFSEIFYSQPPLHIMDYPIIAFLKFLRGVNKVAKRILRKERL